MGLDITAYGQLFRIDPARTKQDLIDTMLDCGHWWQPGSALTWAEKEFPGRTKGTVLGRSFGPRAEEGEALQQDAIYGACSRYTFRAGSYSAHGEFRDFLARLAGWENARAWWDSGVTEGPFFELVNFADNEGVIGCVAAEKLARDFKEHEARALAESDQCRWYFHQYGQWRRACEIASDHGAIDFH